MLLKNLLLFTFLSFKNKHFKLETQKKSLLIDYGEFINNDSKKNNVKKIHSTFFPIILDNNKTSYNKDKGIDERFNKTFMYEGNYTQIIINNEKKKLLDKLTDIKKPELNKLDLLKKSNLFEENIPFNIFGGGLISDW